MSRAALVALLLALMLTACGQQVAAPRVVVSPTPDATTSPSATVRPTPTPPRPVPPVVALIRTGTGPNALAASDDWIWVELHREDRVARIDPETNEQDLVTEVPVHCGVAASPAGGWATRFSSNQLTRFDPDTGEIIEQISIPDVCGLVVEGDDGAWVTSPGPGQILEIRAGEPEPLRAITVARPIFALAVLPDAVWVAGEAAGGTLYRVDRASEGVTSIPLRGVDEIKIISGALWASARFGNMVWKLDATTGEILGEMELQSPTGVAEALGSVWAATLNGDLVEIDPETVEVRSTHPLGYRDLAMPIYAFDSLWVAALENNLVLRVDLALAQEGGS
jgi:streptogramin lyase